MKDIYSGAHEVQVYFGESGVLNTISSEEQATWADPPRSYWFGDDRDHPILNNFGNFQTMTDGQLSRLSPTTRLRQAISSAYTILILLAQGRCLKNFRLERTNPHIWAETLSVLNHLASSPWWKRVWVVEEVILCRSATTIYGEVVAPLDSVERGGSVIHIHIERCCRDFYQSLSGDRRSHLLAIGQQTAALERVRYEWEMYADKEAQRLPRFLGMTRARGAYDARDKIYSLLGLTRECSERLSILPDYSISVSQAYTQTAFKIIRHTNSLEILLTVEKKRTNSELPTWCPDWSCSSNGEENDLWVHSRSWKFNAGPVNGAVANLYRGRVLAVKGVHIDVVSKTTLALSQDAPLGSRLDEFARIVGYDSEPQAHYVTGGTVKQAFWRTMLNEALETESNKYERLTEDDEAFFSLWYRRTRNGSGLRLSPNDFPGLDPAAQREAASVVQARLRIISQSFWLPNDNRAFFVTERGCMGFGPPDMRLGDLVAILLGSKMPFILRHAPLRIKILEDRLVALGQSIPAAVTESAQNDGATGDAPNMEKVQVDETEALLQQITEKTGSLAIDDDGELRYFSSVSNFNLVQKVASNIAERGKPEVRLSQVVTLPLELQEHLLELYFCWQNPWVYIVEKTVFMRDFYDDIATEHCTPLLLWAIYSVAARYSDRTCLRTDPDDPSTAGVEFAVHAKDLLRHECEITTISAVQAAALLSIQCMAENKEPAGWLYIGMATRMAFNIGLNIDCTNLVESGVISKEAANIRQVVWSGCWILDKLFVFGLGRSGTVANHYVTCPKLSTLDLAEFEPWVTPADAQKHVRESFSRIPSTANYMSDHLSLAVATLDIM
ncbi:nitrogen assimilation transcription factor nit-4 [Fusarium proliferatum]|nr:nitrogen assimilation transcription factor nit-4 [Fusarium proliferatum]